MARQSASSGGTIPRSARRNLHIFCDPASQPTASSWPCATVLVPNPADNDLAAKLIDVATFDLERNEPQFSARTVISDGQAKALYAMLGATFVFMIGAPALGTVVLTGIVAVGYLANAIFRGWLFWVAADRQPERSPLLASPAREAELPLYSIIVPLYHEANVVSQLAEALAALDYPAPRLDVILVVEEDDGETCAAARRAGLARNFKVLRVPRVSPEPNPEPATMRSSSAVASSWSSTTPRIVPKPTNCARPCGAFAPAPWRSHACRRASIFSMRGRIG